LKRTGYLFEALLSDENLRRAIDEVNRTHHWRAKHRPNGITAWVEETKGARVEELRQIIVDGFEPKPPRVVRRWDTGAQKWRTVCEPAQWPDQYVHHALVQVLQSTMMRGMDPYCCGSIRGRGTKQARKAIVRWMEKDPKGTKYELTGDIRHFYDSLKPEVVMDRMRQLIKDRRVLDLVWRIVRDGVQIGAYTSQWFANTVLQPLDQLIRQSGLCSHYVRYMDNMTIFGPNKRKLRRLKCLVEAWLNDRGMELKGDWQVFRTVGPCEKRPVDPPRRGFERPKARMPDAVGYRYGRDFSIPRKRSLLRLKRAISRYRRRRRQGRRLMAGVAASLLSRLGQLKHCNNCHLYQILFQGERLVREWKRITRERIRKDRLTWTMFLEQWETSRSLGRRADPTPT
jgi:hypothetical protein